MASTRNDWPERLRAIDWSAYETAYGPAVDVPARLLALASPSGDIRLESSHDLWCGLSHQHAYVSSAAVPALPFLVEALQDADDALALEILDILVGFAGCTGPQMPDRPDWSGRLRDGLRVALPIVQALATSDNEDVRDFVGWFSSAMSGEA